MPAAGLGVDASRMDTTDAFFFPVRLTWTGGKRVLADVDGKDPIEIATPPEFESGIEGVWSPEDFLVAAAASCFAVTLVAIAGRSRVPVSGLGVEGVGRVGKRDDGRFGFIDVTLRVEIETDETHVEGAHRAAERAERHCLVSGALAIPVRLDVTVRAVDTVPA